MVKTAQRDKKIFKPIHDCGGDIKMFGVYKLSEKGRHLRMIARCLKCGAEARKIKDLAVTMYLEKK